VSNDWGYVDADGEYTGGWSGSEASRDRAVGEARSGRVQKRQQQVWNAVRLAGLDGMTWWEVGAAMQMHHGAASGALSNLHKAGRLERLKERRGGSSVYVLPHSVNGRETAPFGRVRAAAPEVGTESQPEPQTDAQALADARQQGYDTGWQAGYDSGIVAAAAERDDNAGHIARAYEDGVAHGRTVAVDGAIRVLQDMLRIASQGQGVAAHNEQCWRRHPACAIRVAIKTVDRQKGVL
jgi:hypothetical protein